MKKLGEPGWGEIIRSAIRARMADVRTAVPGVIVSYDHAKQTCTVNLAVRVPTTDGKPEELPPLSDVPVKWTRGGGYFASMPLNAGDPGLLVFSEVDFTAWRQTGEVSDAVQERRHGLYAYFLPGGCADGHELTSAAADHMVVGKDGGSVIRIKGDGIELGASASDHVALAGLVNTALSNIKDFLTTHVHPAPGGATSVSSTPPPTVSDVAASKVKAE